MDHAIAAPFFCRGRSQHIHREKRGHPLDAAGGLRGERAGGEALIGFMAGQ
jgi:hypothetical protein